MQYLQDYPEVFFSYSSQARIAQNSLDNLASLLLRLMASFQRAGKLGSKSKGGNGSEDMHAPTPRRHDATRTGVPFPVYSVCGYLLEQVMETQEVGTCVRADNSALKRTGEESSNIGTVLSYGLRVIGPIPTAPKTFPGQPCVGTFGVAGTTKEAYSHYPHLAHGMQMDASLGVGVPSSTLNAVCTATGSMETRTLATGEPTTCQDFSRFASRPPVQLLQTGIEVPLVPFIRRPAPVTDSLQLGDQPMAVSFRKFQYTVPHPVAKRQRPRKPSTLPHSRDVETPDDIPPSLSAILADEYVLDAIKGAAYYQAITIVALSGQLRVCIVPRLSFLYHAALYFSSYILLITSSIVGQLKIEAYSKNTLSIMEVITSR